MGVKKPALRYNPGVLQAVLVVLVGLIWGALCHPLGPLTWSPGAVTGPGLREWQSPRKDLEVLTYHLKVTLQVELLSMHLEEALKGEEGPLRTMNTQAFPQGFMKGLLQAPVAAPSSGDTAPLQRGEFPGDSRFSLALQKLRSEESWQAVCCHITKLSS